MRKFFKYFFQTILVLIILIIAGFFIPRKWSRSLSCKTDSVEVIIHSNGYHTSFILPVKNSVYNWRKDLPINSNIQYLEFGWGNKQFYMALDYSVKTTIKALFPSETVMHVVQLDKEPEKWFRGSKAKRLKICREDYAILVNYIRNSFEKDSQHKFIYLGEGLYGPSAFYQGKGNYHGLETCNTWVAKGLRLANINTPLWGGTAPAIMWHLRNYE
jgi:uncharacterized protein (TIGR02117 family)